MAVTELDQAPDLRPLYGKALLSALPGGGGKELPDQELVLTEVTVDRGHLTEYDRVCGFRLSDQLPPTYPHLFGFPLQMKLMTDRSFPLPTMGLVHLENRITQSRPVHADETLSLRVRAENLRKGRQGRLVDFVAEASAGGEPVWHSTSTYLKRGGGSEDGGPDGSSDPAEEQEPDPAEEGVDEGRPAAIWSVPDDTGRRYADVSGDVNPIHMRAVTAKAFGFPRAIAHGMWSKARCLAAFEGRLPHSFTVDVRFKKPVLLPSKVAFRSEQEGDRWRFDLRDPKSGKPHLTGAIRPA